MSTDAVAGSSSHGTERHTRPGYRSKTARRVAQEEILDRLVTSFLSKDVSQSSRAAQKARAIDIVSKDTWSPADEADITASIQGLCRKHTIHLSGELARALQLCYTELHRSAIQACDYTKALRDAGLRQQSPRIPVVDPLIRPDNMADMVKLLLELSKPADLTTRTAALLILNTTEPNRVLYLTEEQRQRNQRSEWLNILLEDPLEGEAWTEQADGELDGSDLSDWSDQSEPSSATKPRLKEIPSKTMSNRINLASSFVIGCQEFEKHTEQSARRRQALEDSVGKLRLNSEGQLQGSFSELEAVRESLLVLMGIPGLLFRRTSQGTFALRKRAAPDRTSLADTNTSGQLLQIVDIANTLYAVHKFADRCDSQGLEASDVQKRSPAIEAFGEQVHMYLQRLSAHLSDYDSDLAAHVSGSSSRVLHHERYVTLPELISDVTRAAETPLLLGHMLQDLDYLFKPVSALTDTSLIDSLQLLLQFVYDQGTLQDSASTLSDLSQCLLAVSTSAWQSICNAMQRGLSFAINRDGDPVFHDKLIAQIVHHDGLLATAESKFWRRGYSVEHGEPGTIKIPAFLQHVMEDVLVTAKSVGLLRSLGIDALGQLRLTQDLAQAVTPQVSDDLAVESTTSYDGDNEAERQSLPVILTDAREHLRALLFGSKSTSVCVEYQETGLITPPSELHFDDNSAQTSRQVASLLEPQLSRSLRSHLNPIVTVVRKRLLDTITSSTAEDGCAFFDHLSAMQGLYFMQKGTDLSDWLDVLFSDLRKPHGISKALEPLRLRAGFEDTVEENMLKAGLIVPWIDTALVRFSVEPRDTVHRASRLSRLADVRVTYQIPWPVNYCIPDECLQTYQAIFTRLLQLKYALWTVSSTIKLVKADTIHLRIFWTLRRNLHWLLLVLLNYLQSDVIDTFIEDQHTELGAATSLDDIIDTHWQATEKLKKLCFFEAGQNKLQDLFTATVVLATEAMNSYEHLIGESSREDDRRARKSRKDRRQKRKLKTDRARAPLGAIAEEDEEDEDEDQDSDHADYAADPDDPDRSPFDMVMQQADTADASATYLSGSSFDVSSSNVSSSGWLVSEFAKQEVFRRNTQRRCSQFTHIVDNLKIRIDDQICRVMDSFNTDPGHHQFFRQRWQDLLYNLDAVH